MSKSATDLAMEYARREERAARQEPEGVQHLAKVWGHLTIFRGVGAETVIAEENDVLLDLSRPGLMIAYDREWNASIYVLNPGWYILFEPSREG